MRMSMYPLDLCLPVQLGLLCADSSLRGDEKQETICGAGAEEVQRERKGRCDPGASRARELPKCQ